MKNDFFENYQLSGLVSMTNEESEAINGGYSWDEFKADCSAAWEGFKSNVKAGFSDGIEAAKK